MTRVADPTSLAEGMRRVVTDDALRETLVRGGRSVVPPFSWARTPSNTLAVREMRL